MADKEPGKQEVMCRRKTRIVGFLRTRRVILSARLYQNDKVLRYHNVREIEHGRDHGYDVPMLVVH